MSTIVSVKKDGIAVIGADTLARLGSSKQKSKYITNHSKIIKICDSYIATVGHASFSLVLSNYFTHLKEIPSMSSPQEIFTMSLDLHNAMKDTYFLKTEEDEDDEFESSRMDCMIVNPHGIFGLYSLRSVDEYTKFYAFGSGYRYALGAMRALYDTNATAEEIAIAGLEAAADFDDGTDLPYEVYQVKLIK